MTVIPEAVYQFGFAAVISFWLIFYITTGFGRKLEELILTVKHLGLICTEILKLLIQMLTLNNDKVPTVCEHTTERIDALAQLIKEDIERHGRK